MLEEGKIRERTGNNHPIDSAYSPAILGTMEIAEVVMVSYQKAHLAIRLAFSSDQHPQKIMGVYWLLLNVYFQFNCPNRIMLPLCRLLVNGLLLVGSGETDALCDGMSQ